MFDAPAHIQKKETLDRKQASSDSALLAENMLTEDTLSENALGEERERRTRGLRVLGVFFLVPAIFFFFVALFQLNGALQARSDARAWEHRAQQLVAQSGYIDNHLDKLREQAVDSDSTLNSLLGVESEMPVLLDDLIDVLNEGVELRRNGARSSAIEVIEGEAQDALDILRARSTVLEDLVSQFAEKGNEWDS